MTAPTVADEHACAPTASADVTRAEKERPDRGRDPSAPGADPLDFIARDVRAMLDAVGRKISLADWRALAREERARLVELVVARARDEFTTYLFERVTARTGAPPRLRAPSAERA